MLPNKKPSDTKVLLILLMAVLMVCLAGSLLYKNLSAIAQNVSASTENKLNTSLTIQQVLIETREAENNIKSYILTHDKTYLSSFYNSATVVGSKLEALQQIKPGTFRERTIVDSIVMLTEERFKLFKPLLYSEDDSKITDELNAISVKIEEAYHERQESERKEQAIFPSDSDTANKKEGFFKRLFGKKSKKQNSVAGAPPPLGFTGLNEQKPDVDKEQLNETVIKVKNKQQYRLAEKKNLELNLNKESKRIDDQVLMFSTEMEKVEGESATRKINSAKNDVNTIKTLSIVISATLTILLLIVGFLIVNYTGKKRQYEAALIQARQSAEELAKTKEAFLANMSHEIKTPLNAIYGFTEQVLKSDLSGKQKEQLNVVKDSANHLIRLISDILDYSKIQAGKIQMEPMDFDLKKELENIKTLFTQQCLNKNLELNFRIDVDVPDYINADLTKLKQVLYNVIGNAIKFTDKGSVSVDVKKDAHLTAPCLSIQITDTGIGIPEGKIEKLFNEYEQLHTDISNKYGGTGLGLVITKKILEHAGGSILIKSKEGKGTDVTLQFPYGFCSVLKPMEDTPRISETLLSDALRNKYILIVDDEPFNRMLLKTILFKYDIMVDEATNGNEAVQRVNSNRYDIVLMDVRMPEKTGIEACREIRLKEKELIILASTAVINKEKTNKCLQAGFNGFIFKPFKERNLLENLYSYLTGKGQGEENPIANSPDTNNKLSFDELFSIANGDEHFKKEMISIFHKSINSGLNQIEESILTGEWVKTAEEAHKILPSCKHFQANSLYNTLKYFEGLREQEPAADDLRIKLQQLKRDIAEVNLELQVYL